MCTPFTASSKERHCHHHPWGQNPWQSFPLESTFFLSPTGLSLGPVLVLLALRDIPWPSCSAPWGCPAQTFLMLPCPTGFQPILPRMRPWRRRWEGAALSPTLHLLCGPATPPAFSQPLCVALTRCCQDLPTGLKVYPPMPTPPSTLGALRVPFGSFGNCLD